MCFVEVGGFGVCPCLYDILCPLYFFCIDDMENVLEAKNRAGLPYTASVLAERGWFS